MAARKNRYHFLTVADNGSGRSIVTLPGQRLGQSDVKAGIIVKDKKGTTLLQRMKKSVPNGTVLFTTTLVNKTSYYEAGDIYTLDGVDNVLLTDVYDAYNALYGDGQPGLKKP